MLVRNKKGIGLMNFYLLQKDELVFIVYILH